MGTLSESVCENVWESKADTLFRPACAQTLVLVNTFSKPTRIIRVSNFLVVMPLFKVMTYRARREVEFLTQNFLAHS